MYDVLKWIVAIVLPALGTAYYGLAMLWHWPFVTEVSGTILLITALLGTVLGVSSAGYKNTDGDGTMTINSADPYSGVATFAFNSDPTLKNGRHVQLKVVDESSQ